MELKSSQTIMRPEVELIEEIISASVDISCNNYEIKVNKKS